MPSTKDHPAASEPEPTPKSEPKAAPDPDVTTDDVIGGVQDDSWRHPEPA